MLPTVETKIWQALKARVQTLPAPVNYPVHFPGDVNFKKPMTPDGRFQAPYIECRHIPNTSVRRFIGSKAPHERMGILQLSLMWPLTDMTKAPDRQYPTEPDTVTQMAGLIAEHFPTDLTMRFQDVAVRVEKAPDVVQPYRDEAYWRVPISIRWSCFA